MDQIIDKTDRAILNLMQQDATLSVDRISAAVHLSRNACWRRIKAMETRGLIKGRVALIDAQQVGLALTAIVLIRTSAHDDRWRDDFKTALRAFPEVVSAYRMTGDLDYVLRVRLADMHAYDRFYKRLTSRISVSDMSASFVMEELQETTAVPL